MAVSIIRDAYWVPFGNSSFGGFIFGDEMKRKLTPKQACFVQEYLVDLNATQAAIRAGYSAANAHKIASQLLGKSGVAEAVAKAQKRRSDRTEITQDRVLERYWQIATANANDLVQFRRVCCRHCYGVEFKYQWRDEAELTEAIERATSAGEKNLPKNEGGFGYDKRKRPNRSCPHCFGEGIGEVFAVDTRDIPESATALYAGVKVTQGGFEVKMHDQLSALQSVARHLGMFNDKLKVEADVSGSISTSLTPESQAVLDIALGRKPTK